MSVSKESYQIFTCDCKKGKKTSPIDIANKIGYIGIKPLTPLPEDVASYIDLVDYLELPIHPGSIKSLAFASCFEEIRALPCELGVSDGPARNPWERWDFCSQTLGRWSYNHQQCGISY